MSEPLTNVELINARADTKDVTLKTIADLVRAHFGEDISEGLSKRLAGKPTPRLEMLHVAYAELFMNRSDAKQEGELRPYVYMPSAENGMLIGPTPPGTISLNSFRHHLLYCHSISFEDRLGHAIWREATGSTAPFLVSVSGVIGYYASYFGELIGSRVVVPLTFDLQQRFESKNRFRAKWDVAQRAADSVWGIKNSDHAADDLEDALIGAHRYGDRSDIWLSDKLHIDVLRKYVQQTKLSVRGNREQLEDIIDVANLKLPAINDLHHRDLISIRRNEEIFEEWRAVLKKAIDARRRAATTGFESPAEAFHEELSVQQKHLRAKARKNRKLFSFASRTFGIGAIGTTASAALFGWSGVEPGLMSGGVSAVADAAAQIVSERKERRARKARDVHFIVALKRESRGH